jgi:quercetin dioxygenase-like cupin family protein
MTDRRNFLSAAAAQVAALGSGQKALVPNKATSVEEAHSTQFPQGLVRLYLNGPTKQLSDLATGTWRVKPGLSPHDVHQHPEEELLIFTEGIGEIMISGIRQPVKPGSVMYCAANLPHGVFNSPNSEMLFYFVKWRA